MLHLKSFNESTNTILEQVKSIKCDLPEDYKFNFEINGDIINIKINKFTKKPDKELYALLKRRFSDSEIDKVYTKPQLTQFIWSDISNDIITYLEKIEMNFYIEKIEVGDFTNYSLEELEGELLSEMRIHSETELTEINIQIDSEK